MEVQELLIAYSTVVSRDSVCIALTIAGLDCLKAPSYYYHGLSENHAYLTADCRKSMDGCWTQHKFGSEAGTIFLVKKNLTSILRTAAVFIPGTLDPYGRTVLLELRVHPYDSNLTPPASSLASPAPFPTFPNLSLRSTIEWTPCPPVSNVS